jgi:hypothetical protein
MRTGIAPEITRSRLQRGGTMIREGRQYDTDLFINEGTDNFDSQNKSITIFMARISEVVQSVIVSIEGCAAFNLSKI